MRKKINIKIEEPCNEHWEEMTTSEKGAFCKACERDLFDFSVMTDIELVHFFSKNNKDFCGRYKKSQLNRDITLDTRHSFSRMFKYLVGLFLALGSVNTVKANPLTEVHFVENIDSEEVNNSDTLYFSGTIKDEDNQVMPFVNIQALDENNEQIALANSDMKGLFSLKISKDMLKTVKSIRISFIGYQSIVIKSFDFTQKNSFTLKNEIKFSEPLILGMITF